MNYEFIAERMELPRKTVRGKWSKIVLEFLDSDSNTCIFHCHNDKEVDACTSALRSYVKRHPELANKMAWGKAKQSTVYLVKC